MTPRTVTAIVAFLAVAAGVVALVLVLDWVREWRQRGQLAENLRQLDKQITRQAEGGGGLLRRESAEELATWLEPIAARVPRIRDIGSILGQAGIQWTVSKFLVLTGGLALAFGLGALVIFGLSAVTLVVAAVGAWLPYLHVSRHRTKRLRKFEEQLPDAVDLIGRAIRAGHPLGAGFRMVAEEAADPVAGEFRQVAEEQRFGLPFEDSITALADRVPLVDVRILITAMLVQREVGGNLAEILDQMASMIRQRFMISRQLQVITAEGRMSMWALMGLPPAVALVIFAMNPDYILTLFREPLGHMMLYASLTMNVLGFLWIRKIIDIEI